MVVKWFVPEERQLEADALVDSLATLAAPRLVVSEVATALSKKVRIEGLSAARAQSSLALWLDHLIPQGRPVLHADEELLPAALDLSIQLNHQLTDCIYLALARKLDARLVTADERFVSKARQLGDRRVIALGDDPSAGSAARR